MLLLCNDEQDIRIIASQYILKSFIGRDNMQTWETGPGQAKWAGEAVWGLMCCSKQWQVVPRKDVSFLWPCQKPISPVQLLIPSPGKNLSKFQC